MRWFRTIVAFSLVPWLVFFGNSQEEWQLQRNRNNISVYSRPSGENGIMKMRAITTLNVPLSNIVAILKDVDYYPQWVYRCSEAEIINQISETEFYYYQVTTVPWPIQNRDMVIHMKLSQNEKSGEVTVELKGKPDYIKEKEGLVRVKIFEGKWFVKPLEGGGVMVTHDILVVPNGSIPTWMVNQAAIEGPFGTLEEMANRVNEARFANRSFPFLKDEI